MSFTAKNMQALEDHLAKNQFLSSGKLPNKSDLSVLEELAASLMTPDMEKFPNVFGWWFTLCDFLEPARLNWSAEEAQKGGKNNKQQQPKSPQKQKSSTKSPKKSPKKAAPAPAPAPAPAEDDDDLDLFGGPTEEELAAQEAAKKQAEEEKKKKEKAKPIAKSRVTFDIKGYELGQDWQACAQKIRDEFKLDGLVWMDQHKVLEIAFGMKKLQMCMIIEDLKISTDDIFEKIEEWEDIQSVDVVDFNKA